MDAGPIVVDGSDSGLAAGVVVNFDAKDQHPCFTKFTWFPTIF